MTDNEIIKALECCIKSSHFGECFDNKCPLVSEKGCKVGKETLYPYALDLLNRLQADNDEKQQIIDHLEAENYVLMEDKEKLKAENERLEEKVENTQIGYNFAKDEIKNLKKDKYKLQKALNQSEDYRVIAKAEAYKECIEKVKEKSCKLNMCHNDVVVKTDYQISGENLDNLLKELVGEDK